MRARRCGCAVRRGLVLLASIAAVSAVAAGAKEGQGTQQAAGITADTPAVQDVHIPPASALKPQDGAPRGEQGRKRVLLEVRASQAVPGKLGLFVSPHSAPIPQGHIIAKYAYPAVAQRKASLPTSSEDKSSIRIKGRALLPLPPFLPPHRTTSKGEEAWQGQVNNPISPGDLGLEDLLMLLKDGASVTLPTVVTHRQLSGVLGGTQAQAQAEEEEGGLSLGLGRVVGGMASVRRVLQGYEALSAASANVALHSSSSSSSPVSHSHLYSPKSNHEVEGGLPPVMLLDEEAAWHLHATKELGPGTELFLTYGANFWLGKIIDNAGTSPLVRLLVYLYLLDSQSNALVALDTGNGDEIHSFPLLAHIYLDANGTPILAHRPSSSQHLQDKDDKACNKFMRDVLGLPTGRGGARDEDRQQGGESTSKGRKARRMQTAGASPSSRLQELVQQVLSSE